MDNASLRNFKDFLQQYNKITETCFSHCVNTLGERAISSEELRCVDVCALKHIRVSHKVMQVYLEVQPVIMNRRLEELNQSQAATIDTTPIETTTEQSIANQPPPATIEPTTTTTGQSIAAQS